MNNSSLAALAGPTFVARKAAAPSGPVDLSPLGVPAHPLPTDPNEAVALVAEQDREDATHSAAAFDAGIRRTNRFRALKVALVHVQLKLSWEEFLDRYFSNGYETYARYHRAARVQVALRQAQLPPIRTEAHARVLGPWLKTKAFAAKVKTALAGAAEYPAASALAVALGRPPGRRGRSTAIVALDDAIRAMGLVLKLRVLGEAEEKVLSAMHRGLQQRRAKGDDRRAKAGDASSRRKATPAPDELPMS